MCYNQVNYNYLEEKSMELGEKLKQARLEAGLSQRQLCGDVITRNMLSLIENGSAKPSMETLKILASRLGKSVSFFLEEDAVVSSNTALMETARKCYDSGDASGVLEALKDYRQPDPVYDREKGLLETLSLLRLAEQAIEERRYPYAEELLGRAEGETAYCSGELQRRRLLLLGRLPGKQVSESLPSLDEELRFRAEEALTSGNIRRAASLLEAAEEQENPRWNLLRGRIFWEEKNYPEAARCLHLAEKEYPKETAPLLERCYREMEDYKRAYEYACRNR
jgi:transcriptional regulator with XRE-family HTH domain